MSKRKTHGEEWWSTAPAHVLRCTGKNRVNGERCKSEALPGTSVCERHGALIPAVLASAATRIQMSVDDAAKKLLAMVEDPAVEARDKVKILHDLLDRGGLAPTSKHLVGVVGSSDPVERLFLDILSDPNGLLDPRALPPPGPREFDAAQAAIDAAEGDSDYEDLISDVVEAELVEDAPARPESHERQRNPAIPPKHIRDALEELGLR